MKSAPRCVNSHGAFVLQPGGDCELLGWSKQQVYQFLNKGQQSALVKTARMVDALGYKLAVVPADAALCYDAYTVNEKVAV